MKTLAYIFLLLAPALPVAAQYTTGQGYHIPTLQQPQQQPNAVYVQGYYDTYGNWVAPHYRTVPNATNHDNYSTQGNRNPHTGNAGYRAPDHSPAAANYGQGRVIYQGPNGGLFYYNDQGHKIYIPKQP